jgi:hypothetical protein
MFAMFVSLFVAVLTASLWALESFLFDAGKPHDASTLELGSIALVTLGTYAWMKRLQAIRQRTTIAAPSQVDWKTLTAVPERYADAKAEAELEETLRSTTEHVA